MDMSCVPALNEAWPEGNTNRMSKILEIFDCTCLEEIIEFERKLLTYSK